MSLVNGNTEDPVPLLPAVSPITETAFSVPAVTDGIASAASPPVITGEVFLQTVAPGQTIDPFSTVSISDPNPTPSDSVTIDLVTSLGGLVQTISDANGILSGPGLTETSSGVYILAASSPATLTTELDHLVFTPTALPNGVTSVRTTLQLGVSNATAGTSTNESIAVTDTAPAPSGPPVIVGTVASQAVTPGSTIDPFSTVAISDPDAQAVDTATISLVTSSGGLVQTISDANGTLSGPGLTETSSGTYTLAATSPATLTQELHSLVFTPTALPGGVTSVATTFDLSVSDSNDNLRASDNSTTVTDTAPAPVLPPPPSIPGLTVFDTTTGRFVAATPQAYTGPVAGLTSDYITTTTDSLNVTATTPGWFIHTGSGNDAIAVTSGTNVLDGSTGSNFLTGGTGNDTFFVDDRGPTSDIWSTVNNFHSGDSATIWGVTPNDFTLSWVNGQGAPGYAGLTLHATAGGVPTASLTLAGFTSADLTNGRLTVSYGTTAATAGVPGSTFMYVHAT